MKCANSFYISVKRKKTPLEHFLFSFQIKHSIMNDILKTTSNKKSKEKRNSLLCMQIFLCSHTKPVEDIQTGFP